MSRNRSIMFMLMTVLSLGSVTGSVAAQVWGGPISRNIYRSPYAGNSQVDMISSCVDHGGSMDSRAVTSVCTGDIYTACTSNSDCSAVGGECEYVLVAPADGIVCTVIEHFDDCGHPSFGNFGNVIIILHDNGEASRHLHIEQWSATRFGITAGAFVTQGQPIGIEGDVGNSRGGQASGCGTDGPPRVGTCFETVPVGATNCLRHNHWNVIRYTTGEVLQPFMCGVTGNIYETREFGEEFYTSRDCGQLGYSDSHSFNNVHYSGRGVFAVRQTQRDITARFVTVKDEASVVYHAGDRVRLLPGFHAEAGGYFRAESSPPEVTAPSMWLAPNFCPCSNVTGFCYQWSDPSSADGTVQGCSPAGPVPTMCHGCFSGGRCCPCEANGTCTLEGFCP